MARELSQDEIDQVFRRISTQKREVATKFDFRRPDRIAKAQLRAIHLLHETFVRKLVLSLSAYLRTYLTVNLVSVEQLSYAEFLQALPSPTCLASIGLKPYDGSGVLEVGPSLIFPVLEILLGGSGKAAVVINRETTEIEQRLLDGFLKIVLNDLSDSWRGVTTIEFSIETMETEPQMFHLLSPNEAVVAVAVEIRIGECVGIMNLAMPSLIVRTMRQKFDQQWSMRKTDSTNMDQTRMLGLIQDARVHLDAILRGESLLVEDFLALREGDVLSLDVPVDKPIECLLNGKVKYQGKIVSNGRRRTFRVAQEF